MYILLNYLSCLLMSWRGVGSPSSPQEVHPSLGLALGSSGHIASRNIAIVNIPGTQNWMPLAIPNPGFLWQTQTQPSVHCIQMRPEPRCDAGRAMPPKAVATPHEANTRPELIKQPAVFVTGEFTLINMASQAPLSSLVLDQAPHFTRPYTRVPRFPEVDFSDQYPCQDGRLRK